LTGTSTTTGGTTTGTTTAAALFDNTDIVQFTYKRHLGIAIGTTKPDAAHAPGGIFLIDKAKGFETLAGTTKKGIDNGDRIFLTMTGFLRDVGGRPITLAPGAEVQVLLGNKLCLADFPITAQTSSNLLKPSGSKLVIVLPPVTSSAQQVGLKSLIIDNKRGTILIQTNGVDPGAIFPQSILEAGVPFQLPVTITILNPHGPGTPTFDAQGSVAVFRKGNKIINQ